ncbi:DUF4157 domain-containing protein [Moorena sp. SIO3I8]|uniref:eCIS core domain-containing protein n=1 Tax=Moorena sp. SIO3I8 TaxID=2607833 RepID=UPI0025F61511|nr:DUF4157 domain-containing protein [Moorena sp. SIO3I8]
MRTTHTYKPKYSHSTSLSIAQKKKDSRRKGYREILEAEEREWNAEDAVGEWGSMSANVMRTLESGVTQPERGRREIGLQGKFSLGQPGDRSRQGENHGGHKVLQPKRMMVQLRAQPLTGDELTYGDSMRESRSQKENKTGLPDRLKAGIENLSGYSMDDVRVHYNSSKPAQLQALAYAQGTEIHVGPGQEKHLPHEAWHVVQQKQGRVQRLRKEKGVRKKEERQLEEEATAMGSLVLRKVTKEESRELETEKEEKGGCEKSLSVLGVGVATLADGAIIERENEARFNQTKADLGVCYNHYDPKPKKPLQKMTSDATEEEDVLDSLEFTVVVEMGLGLRSEVAGGQVSGTKAAYSMDMNVAVAEAMSGLPSNWSNLLKGTIDLCYGYENSSSRSLLIMDRAWGKSEDYGGTFPKCNSASGNVLFRQSQSIGKDKMYNWVIEKIKEITKEKYPEA